MARPKVIKRCRMCHKMKNLSEYYVDKKEGDKHKPICKKCFEKMKNS